MEERNSSRWRLPLELFGAAAGLAALVYTTGAATLWLRYATSDFPADLALSVTSRERIVALGFRILLIWALAVSATMLVVIWLSRQKRVSSTARRVRDRLCRVPVLGGMPWTLVAVLAILASAFVTWGLLTVVVVAIIVVFFSRRYRLHEPSAGPSDHLRLWRLGLLIAAAAAVLGVGWQLQVNLIHDHAKLHFKRPPPRWPQITDAIYFGQADGAYYVAPHIEPDGPFEREIVAVRPEELRRFEFLPWDQPLCSAVPRPIVSAERLVEGLWNTMREHLTQSGQRVKPPDKPLKYVGHGVCPNP